MVNRLYAILLVAIRLGPAIAILDQNHYPNLGQQAWAAQAKVSRGSNKFFKPIIIIITFLFQKLYLISLFIFKNRFFSVFL